MSTSLESVKASFSWFHKSALRLALFCTLGILLQLPAGAQSLADQALAKSRAGLREEALQLYKQAVAEEPNNVAILRDYAVVLGSTGKYSEAIPVIRKARSLSAEQPVWALQEFAGIYLFGDAVPDALNTLDELIRGGDSSEPTLNRRALALRWLNRSREAEEAYKTLLGKYPASEDAVAGLAYTLANEQKFSQALGLLNSPAPQIVKAKIRILNWAGRHYEAQELLNKLPAGLETDREVLEDRVAAARWGGDPSGAVKSMQRLSALYPGVETSRLSQDLREDYGHAVAPTFRYGKDSFGLTERSLATDVTVHLNPAHTIHAGYQYRWFEQEGEGFRTLVRYELGWGGNLSRRVSAYASGASVDYRESGLKMKIVGDASIALAISDKFKVNGGGGVLAMDAFPALHSQVTAPFEFGELAVRANSRTQLQARYSRYAFSDNVIRQRVDFQGARTLFSESRIKVRAGWRIGGMWHDQQTPDFWSPSRFYSTLATAQAEGSVGSWMEYSGEIAGGFQSERGNDLQHPLQVLGKITLHPKSKWRTAMEFGRSTSSIDRLLPGQRAYSRWIVGVGSEFRFP